MQTTNVEPTCNWAGAAVSPAWAAVLRDVLVTSSAGIVDAVNVPPVPGLWQGNEVQQFMRTRCSPKRRADFSFGIVSLGEMTWATGSLKGFHGEADGKQVDPLCSWWLLRNLGELDLILHGFKVTEFGKQKVLQGSQENLRLSNANFWYLNSINNSWLWD